MAPERQGKRYTAEEDEFICEHYGYYSLGYIAKNLHRTETGIYRRANSLCLGRSLEYAGWMTEYQITQILGIDNHTIERNWRQKGFPQRRHKIRKQTTEITNVDELVKWLEKHQDLWDARKVKYFALGVEPNWLCAKRQRDALKSTKPRGQKWSANEDFYLCMYSRKGLTQKEIGEKLGRSESSVNARVQKLDIWGTGKIKPEYTEKRKAKYGGSKYAYGS